MLDAAALPGSPRAVGLARDLCVAAQTMRAIARELAEHTPECGQATVQWALDDSVEALCDALGRTAAAFEALVLESP